MSIIRDVSEQVARKTSRRGFFGRGTDMLFGALAGVAAGTITGGGGSANAGIGTLCVFPGPPCACDRCLSTGLCAKPCVILTFYYASGCWVEFPTNQPVVTCCDCDCADVPGDGWCGCGSDYHNNPTNCP